MIYITGSDNSWYTCPDCKGRFTGGHYCVGKPVVWAVTNNTTPKLTYLAYYKCTNCGKEDNLQIAKGTLAPERAQCPKCGCMTMEKVLR